LWCLCCKARYWGGGVRSIENTLIYLTGYPASGKLTIAKELCKRIRAYLVDNHTINNPILQLVRTTGSEKLDPRVWKSTSQIRDVVLDAMVEMADPKASFVMTNVLVDDKGDWKLFEKIRSTAEQRGALFVPVKLICDEKILLGRVSNPERLDKLKLTDANKLQLTFEQYETLPFTHDNMLIIDSGKSSSEASAKRIIQHIGSL